MSTPSCLTPVMTVFLERGRPVSLKDLGREVRKSRATVTRWVSQLREDGWLLPQLGGGTGDRLLLNLDRPGMNAYLSWLFIETGLSIDTYERWVDRSSGRLLPYEDVGPPLGRTNEHRAELLEKAKKAYAASFRLTTGQDVSDLPPQHAREAARTFNRACSIPYRAEAMMQRIYHGLHNERARDFVHLMIHLGEDLYGLPEAEGLDTQHRLLVTALLADHNAAVIRDQYAARVSEAAQRGHAQADINAALAEWAQDYWLPGTTFHRGGIYHNAAGTGMAAQRRRILSQINSRGLVHHGGLTQPSDAGQGGDVLLAQMLLDETARLYRLIEGIRALPAMQPLFTMPAIAELLPEGPYQQYPGDGLEQQALTDARRGGDRLPLSEDRLPGPGDTAARLEVTGDLLRRGDQILQADTRAVPTQPVVLERTGQTARVLLEGCYELADLPCPEDTTYTILRASPAVVN